MTHTDSKLVDCLCRECDSAFAVTIYRIRAGRGIFCSVACANRNKARRMIATTDRRFWSRVAKTDTCWLWQGAKTRNGYGVVTVKGKSILAHRYAYETCVGPVPTGLTLDHVWDRGCRNRHCVNPAHLEPVTNHENHRRGKHARKTHCPNGHAYTPENTGYRSNGHRHCRICAANQQRTYRARRQQRSGL